MECKMCEIFLFFKGCLKDENQALCSDTQMSEVKSWIHHEMTKEIFHLRRKKRKCKKLCSDVIVFAASAKSPNLGTKNWTKKNNSKTKFRSEKSSDIYICLSKCSNFYIHNSEYVRFSPKWNEIFRFIYSKVMHAYVGFSPSSD